MDTTLLKISWNTTRLYNHGQDADIIGKDDEDTGFTRLAWVLPNTASWLLLFAYSANQLTGWITEVKRR